RRVLMLPTLGLDEYAYSALKAGASGFLLKDVPPEELLFGIRAVHSGDAVVAPSTTRRLIDRFAPLFPAGDGPAPPDLACLTGREREVLAHVAQGLSNAEIAGRLFVSEATVKTHVGRGLARPGRRGRSQAGVSAHEPGLARPRGPGWPPAPPSSAVPGARRGPAQRPAEPREDSDGRQPPGVDLRDVDEQGGDRQGQHNGDRPAPVVTDDEVVPERAERPEPPAHPPPPPPPAPAAP